MCKAGHTDGILFIIQGDMEVAFHDQTYERLETDRAFSLGFPSPVVTSYRKRLGFLRAATGGDDLAAMKCLGLRKINSAPGPRLCIRLQDDHYLVLEQISRSGKTTLLIHGIETNPV